MFKNRMKFLSEATNREKFFKVIAQFLPTLDPRYQLIKKAYNDAKDAFRDKVREEGVRYFEHLRAVTLILILYLRVTDYRLIVAALLHDIVEDCPEWTITRVLEEYGPEIALLVEYMTKPKGYKTDEERDQVYHHRFRMAPRDFFLIKLTDRFHNLLTLQYCPLEKRVRKIKETREHYLSYAETHMILYHEMLEVIEQVEKTNIKTK